MVWFLWEECGDIVSKATVSRTLKREAWSKKKAQRIVYNISYDLRKDYLTSMAGIRAEQMVFLNGYRVDQLYAFKRVGSRFSSKFENPQSSSPWPCQPPPLANLHLLPTSTSCQSPFFINIHRFSILAP